MSRWLLDFVAGDPGEEVAGFVRLELREHEEIAWYWTYIVGFPGVDGVLVVRDHEVLLPRQGLEIRADGLWAELTCETPREHWTFGLEAFGVRLDGTDAGEFLRADGEIGERIAVGLDIEWEVGAGGPPRGIVHGDVLVGRASVAVDGVGWFYDDGDPDPGESNVHSDVVSTVYVPLPGGRHVSRRLVRAPGGLRWTLERDGGRERAIPEHPDHEDPAGEHR
ncbi:MAG: hypothetical protein QOG50_213 [Actinomycetota bacterium]|nr:hypothetical protein [Actinomycetes bacterium]MDQ1508369.1 hypothetical protein [Actinomycetota bacterium]